MFIFPANVRSENSRSAYRASIHLMKLQFFILHNFMWLFCKRSHCWLFSFLVSVSLIYILVKNFRKGRIAIMMAWPRNSLQPCRSLYEIEVQSHLQSFRCILCFMYHAITWPCMPWIDLMHFNCKHLRIQRKGSWSVYFAFLDLFFCLMNENIRKWEVPIWTKNSENRLPLGQFGNGDLINPSILLLSEGRNCPNYWWLRRS